MRAGLGIRSVITVLFVGGIALTAFVVHSAWYNTAERNSRTLVTTLVNQITNQVRKDFWSGVVLAEEQFSAAKNRLEDDLVPETPPALRIPLLTEVLRSSSRLSILVHATPDGAFVGARRTGDGFETISCPGAAKDAGSATGICAVTNNDGSPADTGLAGKRYDPRSDRWFSQANAQDGAAWSPVRASTPLDGAIAAFSGAVSIAEPKNGVLATFRYTSELAYTLGDIDVGVTGGVFVLGPDGEIVISPEKMMSRTSDMLAHRGRLTAAAAIAGNRIRSRPESAKNIVENARIVTGGETYSVALNPLEFRDWQLAVVIPEAEFLSEIEATTRRLFIGLIVVVLLAGLVSTWLGRRLVANPIRAFVSDLKKIETFDLANIAPRPSNLAEFDALSEALQRVRVGLTAFGRFIPTDLVRGLLADGMDAKPGGHQREITVFFADIAGFTGISERLGEKVVPLISSYFDVMSTAISANNGTIDKFIGDAVMAFWGAPKANVHHAEAACRAALACVAALRKADIQDDKGNPLSIRIGLNTGLALVGNIGSSERLNYTAIGDSVNVASRIEGVNKYYRTTLLIGEETRRAAGTELVAREVDMIAVYGRMEGIAVFEPICMRDQGPAPDWVSNYAAGLSHYRSRHFAEAMNAFRQVLEAKRDDGPSQVLISACENYIANPPPENWKAITVMDAK